jgi:ATP-binding cassette, subfamily C (CFTR/MRP), member 1
MVRAAVISLIYAKALKCSALAQEDVKTVTLMSTDADRVVNGLELVHETWARLLEIAIGIWLLSQQMGAISISPVLVAVGMLTCFLQYSCVSFLG